MGKLIITTDGAAKPNPGRGSWGFHIFLEDEPQKWWTGMGVMEGKKTNNDAEYSALISALVFTRLHIVGHERFDEILCRSDSELMVHHNMRVKDPETGKDKWMAEAKKPNLVALRNELWRIIDQINKTIKLKWISGDTNEIAHNLTEKALMELQDGHVRFEDYKKSGGNSNGKQHHVHQCAQ